MWWTLPVYWQENPVVSVDSFPTIAAGGTAGLILFLLLALYFFASGKVRWVNPEEATTLKAQSESVTSLKNDVTKVLENQTRMVDLIGKQNGLLETLVREREVDREVERRLKAKPARAPVGG